MEFKNDYHSEPDCITCGESALSHKHHRDMCRNFGSSDRYPCKHCSNYKPRNMIIRNMSTPETRAFWEGVEQRAERVSKWPCWKRNVQCPGQCALCSPLSDYLKILFLNLGLIGWCAHYSPPKQPTRWNMLEID